MSTVRGEESSVISPTRSLHINSSFSLPKFVATNGSEMAISETLRTTSHFVLKAPVCEGATLAEPRWVRSESTKSIGIPLTEWDLLYEIRRLPLLMLLDRHVLASSVSYVSVVHIRGTL